METFYSAINKELAKEFGARQVQLRPAKGKDYEFTLWFKEDRPSRKTIKRAKEIVGNIEPSIWFDEMQFRSK